MTARKFRTFGLMGVAALAATGWGVLAQQPAPPAPPDAALERGKKVLDRLDPGAGQRVLDNYAKVSPEFGKDVVRYPFGDVYSSPGLDTRTRLLAAVAALTAVGDSEAPLGTHIRYALNAGCKRDEIAEVIRQTAVYAGFPRAVKALAVAEKAFADYVPPHSRSG